MRSIGECAAGERLSTALLLATKQVIGTARGESYLQVEGHVGIFRPERRNESSTEHFSIRQGVLPYSLPGTFDKLQTLTALAGPARQRYWIMIMILLKKLIDQ